MNDNDKGIVRQLIDGSTRIDQMKGEIQLIIGLLLSFLSANWSPSSKDDRLVLETTSGRWEFQEGRWRGVKCSVYFDSADSAPWLIFDPDLRDPWRFHSLDSGKIRGALDALVEKILSEFPNSYTAWAPLFNAGSEEE